jgi:putative flippase GtrA
MTDGRRADGHYAAGWAKRPQIVRFVLVGGVNTAFSYGIYALFLAVGVNYAFANLLALIAGILFSFKTQGRLVFNSADNRLIVRFVGGWAVIYAINLLLLRQLIAIGIDRYLAGALVIPAIMLLSYVIQRFLVFSATARSWPDR